MVRNRHRPRRVPRRSPLMYPYIPYIWMDSENSTGTSSDYQMALSLRSVGNYKCLAHSVVMCNVHLNMSGTYI